MEELSSPSRKPFITIGYDNHNYDDDSDFRHDEGPTSPYHSAMEDGGMIMVEASPSDFSMPPPPADTTEQQQLDNGGDVGDATGIMMIHISSSSGLEASVGAQFNYDNNMDKDDDDDSAYSTLKVHQGSADFDLEFTKGTFSINYILIESNLNYTVSSPD